MWEIFRNMVEAQIVIESWREEYNRYRPHSSLGYLTSEEFAAQCRAEAVSTPQTPGEVIDSLQVLTL